MPVLADIFSAGNILKRRLRDFAADPVAYLETGVANLNQRASEFNALHQLATQGEINKLRNQPITPEQQAAELKLRDILAGAYNPIGLTVYHGSPHLFPRFDLKKIGTGEGNQAYGVGAGYTAEARPVAEEYKRQLGTSFNVDNKLFYSGLTGKKTGSTGNTDADDYLLANLGNIDQAIANARRDMKEVVAYNPSEQDVFENTINYLENLKSKGSIKQKSEGYLYKGDIPDEIIPKFLDYDKPIKEQSAEVQALAKQLGIDLEDLGGDLLARAGKNLKGTQTMFDAGIKGIRYLDQGSRGQGKGTSNFIPFSPEDFKIQEINDIPIQSWVRSGQLKLEADDPLMRFLTEPAGDPLEMFVGLQGK